MGDKKKKRIFYTSKGLENRTRVVNIRINYPEIRRNAENMNIL